MKVTIWDMDYFYAEKKVNCFDSTVMKISSYHKQLGDEVTLVLTQYDIYRPYDIYYICRQKKGCPLPPRDFFLNGKVRWIGKANATRQWTIPDVVLACRPDYLLYPEKNTIWERSEQIRLLNSNGEMMPIVQDWHNVFKRKRALITDTQLWTTSAENLKKALETLAEIQNVTFLEPIWLQKIASDKSIEDLFFKLILTHGSNLKFLPIFPEEYQECKRLLEKMRLTWPTTKIGALEIKLRPSTHWEDREFALRDFEAIKRIIVDAKKSGFEIRISELKNRLDSPYFAIFETIATWMNKMPQRSWLEYLSMSVGYAPFGQLQAFWAHPSQWNEMFRDLLRQTYEDKEFLLTIWKEKSISENDIPWIMWRQEFALGI